MKKVLKYSILLFGVFFISTGWKPKIPVIYLIGDSTVRNFNEKQRGWGTYLERLLDTERIHVENKAMAGRSTRTFVKEKRWQEVREQLKPGDFVLMQFGHNEGSAPDITKAGYRGVLKGLGNETKVLVWPDGTSESVHTYGWYLRQFIRDTQAKGAIPVVLSMIPRNQWKDGKVLRAAADYGKWAKEVARAEKAFFVDLNQITADKYDQWGPNRVKALFYKDHTHTNEEGAIINAQSVIEGIQQQKKIKINRYVKD